MNVHSTYFTWVHKSQKMEPTCYQLERNCASDNAQVRGCHETSVLRRWDIGEPNKHSYDQNKCLKTLDNAYRWTAEHFSAKAVDQSVLV